MPKNNEITVAPKNNSLVKAQNDFFTNILGDLSRMNLPYTEYGKICGLHLIAAINHLLNKEGLTFEDEKVDQASITNSVQFVMLTELDIDNNEIFINFRNDEIKTGKLIPGDDGKQHYETKWVKKFECKEQYRGRIKNIQKYGVNVDHVYPIWVVREGDAFTYATYKGVDLCPPTWSPKGYTNKVIRVVVPVKYKTGEVEYHIAELDSLATNVKAQIKQTLLGWKAKGDDDGSKNKAKKIALLIKDMSLEQLLACEDVKKIINSTYTGISKEEMYITKLTLNATKRIMVDYGNAMLRELAEKTYDNADVYEPRHNAREIINEQNGVGDVVEIEQPKEPEQIPETPQVDDNGEVKGADLTPEKFFEEHGTKGQQPAKIDPPVDVTDDDLPF